jgi:RNA polymerase sigma factor (sigma-70 family)
MLSSSFGVVVPQPDSAAEQDRDGRSDGELLSRFLSHRDSGALAALVRRHAPMVWGVCRRVLRNSHDAEDAFQAAFLVLVRKAATVVPRQMVANWLYGVAHQTAVRLRAAAVKRGAREMQMREMPEPLAVGASADELLALLDQELSRLPERFRTMVVLCDLEGKTRKEVARQLGHPEGTVASRLARARELLAKRLARRGMAISGVMLAAVLSHTVASAVVPATLVTSTIQFATGQAASVISSQVAALAEGVVKAMMMSKLKTVVALVLLLSITTIGVVGIVLNGAAAQTENPPVKADNPPVVEKRHLKELKRLEGDWIVQRIEAGGKKHQLGEGEQMVLTIQGTKWTMPANREQGEVVALDPTCNPKLIDLKSTPRGREAFMREGIYKVDGDTFTIVLYQGKDKKRPTNFDTPTEEGTVLFALTRAKKQ